MKIIKEGATAQSFKPVALDCHHCGAALQADKISDFTRYAGDDQRDGPWDYLTVKCPCCQHYIRIETLSTSIHKFFLDQMRRG